MKNITNLAMVFFATAILYFVGCGGDLSTVPVSGKVTLNGKPVEGIRLVFSPVLKEDSTDAGPWSTGVTNSEGEYTLATRYKKNGASVGKHVITFMYDDTDDIEGLRDELSEASGEDGSKAEVDGVKKRIADYFALQKGRPKISDEYTDNFEVPVGGTKEANFELPK